VLRVQIDNNYDGYLYIFEESEFTKTIILYTLIFDCVVVWTSSLCCPASRRLFKQQTQPSDSQPSLCWGSATCTWVLLSECCLRMKSRPCSLKLMPSLTRWVRVGYLHFSFVIHAWAVAH